MALLPPPQKSGFSKSGYGYRHKDPKKYFIRNLFYQNLSDMFVNLIFSTAVLDWLSCNEILRNMVVYIVYFYVIMNDVT